MPLVNAALLGKISNSRLNPTFQIENVTVALHPLEIVSIATKSLGQKVDSLASERDRIIGAVDEVLLP